MTISTAGHAYFGLKDERSQLQCVWFRDDRQRSAFQPQAGLRVVAHGRIDLFEPQGALQLYVESIQPSGFGDLALRFEALKARLAPRASSRRPASDRCRRVRARRGDHEPDRRGLARHLHTCSDPALAADPGRARRRAGPGRRGAGQHRHCVPPPGAVDRRSAMPMAGPGTRPR